MELTLRILPRRVRLMNESADPVQWLWSQIRTEICSTYNAGAEHYKYTENIKCKWYLWSSIRWYQRTFINGFVSLKKKSTNEGITYKIINGIQLQC